METLTHAQAMQHCQNLLNTTDINTIFEDDILKMMVLEQDKLLGYDYFKLDSPPIIHFKIKSHPKYKSKGFRIIKGKRCVLWGYKKCLDDIYKKKLPPLATNPLPKKGREKNMREIIWRHKRMRFLKSHATFVRRIPMAECSVCITLCKVAVDHFPISFQQIQDEFFAIFPKREDSKKKRQWDKEWIQFHDNRATFRLVCKSCNSKGGNYGYENISSSQ